MFQKNIYIQYILVSYKINFIPIYGLPFLGVLKKNIYKYIFWRPYISVIENSDISHLKNDFFVYNVCVRITHELKSASHILY